MQLTGSLSCSVVEGQSILLEELQDREGSEKLTSNIVLEYMGPDNSLLPACYVCPLTDSADRNFDPTAPIIFVMLD